MCARLPPFLLLKLSFWWCSSVVEADICFPGTSTTESIGNYLTVLHACIMTKSTLSSSSISLSLSLHILFSLSFPLPIILKSKLVHSLFVPSSLSFQLGDAKEKRTWKTERKREKKSLVWQPAEAIPLRWRSSPPHTPRIGDFQKSTAPTSWLGAEESGRFTETPPSAIQTDGHISRFWPLLLMGTRKKTSKKSHKIQLLECVIPLRAIVGGFHFCNHYWIQ